MRKWFLILIGTLTWSVTMVKSGLSYGYGLGFWGANGHDALWHLSLIESLSRFSFALPSYAGNQITNYHVGFDVFVAMLTRLSGLQSSIWYFQILPPIFALAIGYLTYSIVSRTNGAHAAWWSTFMVYFGTGFGFLIGHGESAFWSQQSISTLINPPFAVSLILILLIIDAQRSQKKWLTIFLLALLPQIKIYAGILMFISLGLYSLKSRKMLVPVVIAALIALPLYFLVNPSSGGLIVFQPFWFLDTLFAPDRLNIPWVFSALNTFKSGAILIKLIPLYGFSLVIFVCGNAGLRIVSAVAVRIKAARLPESPWLYIGSLAGLVFSLTFTQKGTAWNTIQFFYYSLFFMSLIFGPVIAWLVRYVRRFHILLAYTVVTLLITFNLAGTIDSLRHYVPGRPPAMISHAELASLQFLRGMSRGTTLIPPYDRDAAQAAIPNPPRPLALYESTAYVSAYAAQPVFLEDEVNLSITGVEWTARKVQVMDFFRSTNIAVQSEFITQNNIKYLYLTPYYPAPVSLPPNLLLYDHDGFKIYEFTVPTPHT